jgi:hypothetical protein
MKEMDKKLEEVKANQQRMEDNMKNLKQEIIDEIRGSVSSISYIHGKELLVITDYIGRGSRIGCVMGRSRFREGLRNLVK